MPVLLVFAFLSGIVTILSPCILPILPIVLSGSVGGKRKALGVITGFVVSFSVFMLILSSAVQAAGVSSEVLRAVAVILIAFFGLTLLIPRLRRVLSKAGSRIAGSKIAGALADGKGKGPRSGYLGGLAVGMSLGLVWTPCVGPIVASVIGLAVTQSIDGGAVLIVLAYSIGTSLPMFGVMIGGRTLLNRVPLLVRNSGAIQRTFGALLILVAAAIGFGWDRQFQTAVLRLFPGYGSGLTAIEDVDPVRRALDARAEGDAPAMMSESIEVSFDVAPKNGRLGDYGEAPPLVANGPWFNADHLELGAGGGISMDDLKGKVVLVDFWTYSCINCVRTLPHLRSWYDTYHDMGLEIIGVHTPEFAFERNENNVRKAIADLGVTWPVVLDNNYAQWRAFENRYWPAHYFIDAEGTIRYFHFGEGEYDNSETVIRKLLEEAGSSVARRQKAGRQNSVQSRTAETYLGYARSKGLISDTKPLRGKSAQYRSTAGLGNGEWTLGGTWTVNREHILHGEEGVLDIGFHAKRVFLVVEPVGEGGTIEVKVDGAPAGDTPDVSGGVVKPEESRLYELVTLPESGMHTLNLKVFGNLRLFAFTFG